MVLQFADLRSTNKELLELGLEVGFLYKKTCILSQKQALDQPCTVKIVITAYYSFLSYMRNFVKVLAVVTFTILLYFALIFFSFTRRNGK